jgi:signal peptidase I
MVFILVLLAVRTWALEPVRIPSSSMSPTLVAGEHVLVDKVLPERRTWHRGDVVLFRAPDNGTLTIKRLVGLAGDTVEIRDGLLYVNGAEVTEPYVVPGAIDSVYWGPVTVAAEHVVVLGDNRRNSLDSRTYGGVSVHALEGKVAAVLWPADRIGGVR